MSFVGSYFSFVVEDDVFLWFPIICDLNGRFCLLQCAQFRMFLWCKAHSTKNIFFPLEGAVKVKHPRFTRRDVGATRWRESSRAQLTESINYDKVPQPAMERHMKNLFTKNNSLSRKKLCECHSSLSSDTSKNLSVGRVLCNTASNIPLMSSLVGSEVSRLILILIFASIFDSLSCWLLGFF